MKRYSHKIKCYRSSDPDIIKKDTRTHTSIYENMIITEAYCL